MLDIEDAAVELAPDRPNRGVGKRVTTRSASKSKPDATDDGSLAGACGATADATKSCIPGKQSIYVKTYGCSHNSSDSEYMCGLLEQYGYTLVSESEREAADLWLINSCTVKNPSEEHMATDLKRGRALGKSLVVAGCVSQAQPDLAPLADLSIVGVQQIERVVEVVQSTLEGNTVRLLSRAQRPSLDLPKVRRNPLVEIIACNTGCLGSCTYCKTVYARGRLGSYEPAALRKRMDDAFAEGVVEVWLTSEDTGAYGRDIGSSMPELLELLLAGVPEGRMLRVGMTNPPYMLEHMPEIARLLRHPRCYAFLHVPVQSGSDNVLHGMRREYTRAEFETVANALTAEVPQMTLATDIICGFPGESEADHDATLSLVSKYRFPILNISQFYPRQGTPAAKMPRVNTQRVKERTREVSNLFASYTTLEHLLHSEHDCLVTEIAHDGVSLVAHTKGYVQVLLSPEHPEWMGCMLRVRITECAKFYVRGEVISVLHQAPNPELAAKVLAHAKRNKRQPKAAGKGVSTGGPGSGGGGNGESRRGANGKGQGERPAKASGSPPQGDCEAGACCSDACACGEAEGVETLASGQPDKTEAKEAVATTPAEAVQHVVRQPSSGDQVSRSRDARRVTLFSTLAMATALAAVAAIAAGVRKNR